MAALQEPELLETLYVTQQMAPEAAELALETALRTLSNAITGSAGASTRQDSSIPAAISGLQEASHKYGQVGKGPEQAAPVCAQKASHNHYEMLTPASAQPMLARAPWCRACFCRQTHTAVGMTGLACPISAHTVTAGAPLEQGRRNALAMLTRCCRCPACCADMQCRDMAWQARASAEAALLLKEQLKLERETGQALFVGLSLADTLSTCFRLGHARAAAGLRKTFAVPEASWYWLKLTALAAAHDWDGEAHTCQQSAAPLSPASQSAASAGGMAMSVNGTVQLTPRSR